MAYTQIDQTRFFMPGNNVDVMAERFLGTFDEVCRFRLPKRIGAYNAHVFRSQRPQSLAEAGEAFQSPRLSFFRKLVIFIQPGGKADHFLVLVQHLDTPLGFLRDDALLFVVAITDEDEEFLGTNAIEIHDTIVAAKNGVRQHHWPFGNMPPVEGITDSEISNIIAYVRTVQRANGIY